MTRQQAKHIASQHGMEIVRDPITHEAWECSVESRDLIPELDTYADGDLYAAYPCVITRKLYGDIYRYELICPTEWFDLWGWRDD